ncbi:MAG: transglutaminase-like cysteine peptidase [Nitrososphaera sp.]|nr:transglutaminase-like cysteine peptidase [Nitrososphaera sp.]
MHALWMILAVEIGLLWTAPVSRAEEMVVPPANLPAISTHLAQTMEFQPIIEPKSLLDEFARTYTTPQAIASFLHDNFTFKRDDDLFDQVDHWQTPYEFIMLRAGDCEDFALLAQTLLQRNGIDAHVLSLFGEDGYAHTVSVFRDEKGKYNVINQGEIRYYRAQSLEALATQLYPDWTVADIVEQDGARGHVVREIRNDRYVSSPGYGDELAAFQF